MKIGLLVGAFLGVTSVMMSAYTDHVLALILSEHSLKMLATAIRYHQLYAIVICMLALVLPLQTKPRSQLWLCGATFLFIVGVLIFSGSIYSAAIFDMASAVKFAPYGGGLLILAWIILMLTALEI